ncbi:MAG: HD domain-containing protein [Helicobacteraceae bacterium]|jgi:putative hydrolase of HD superfamily|nr:HD domain-containing protein [Helicobacteraceae bacterium]
MISPELIAFFYNAASIQRWNDYPRLVELTELDKQAHKFIIAYFLASYEDNISFPKMIEAGIFEFLRRALVTDIRPDVYRRVIAEKKKEINEWFLQQIKPIVDNDFFEKINLFFKNESVYKNERKLLAAAHYLATRYEFNIVYQSGGFLSDIEELRRSVESEISLYSRYKGVVEIGLSGDIAKIVDLCGRLRFQIRWSQTPRLPKTSVLGHMLMVALFSFFYSTKIGACESRLVNNFYCALFHDLPEVLTRDIISPVKHGIGGLEHIVNNYEIELITGRILPLVPKSLQEQFSYLLGLSNEGDHYYKNEFANRIKNEHMIQVTNDLSAYNSDRFQAIDGEALKACDHLAAFTEAALSMHYGIRSRELDNGLKTVDKYEKIGAIGGVDFAKIMRNFENRL